MYYLSCYIIQNATRIIVNVCQGYFLNMIGTLYLFLIQRHFTFFVSSFEFSPCRQIRQS